ncbi:uncharacterized protein LY89DRAFT_781486 [Mollisia scopiformis]|uniref:Alcohol acetyltransferase n=1 Tax=Mollisia scopiformis TaxID=149040 RepID=A0A194XE63_MOLSC|nr:uncharacterized protein LY89DRAFT_781486 [Mollisia scopiformis]KUJ18434.1 hypothetical protein LY89DRAFT_781486 [Mollisia scopiformis]
MSEMGSPTANIDRFQKLRPLGALEQFSSARHHLGFYHNVGISATYSHVTEVNALSSLEDVILKAVAAVVQKHPILLAIVIDEDSPNPYFARLPSIDIREAVTFLKRETTYIKDQTDIEIDRILEDQHNKGFKTSFGKLPFWRLIIVTNSDVEFVASFIFHHSLGDGASGLVFHKDFLAGLQDKTLALVSTVVHPRQTDLLPNLELLHPLPIQTPKPALVHANLWSGREVTMPTQSHFRSLFLSQSTSQGFVQACKSHGTTVTATIPVIMAIALMENIEASFDEVECTVPVSLRRWMPNIINEDSFGVWIDAFSQYYHRENVSTFSWDEARRSRETISEYLKSDGQCINVAKFQKIKDMREFFLSRVGKERGTSFDVSNLGGIKAGQQEGSDWTMGRVVFGRSAFVSGSAIAVGVVSGMDGCLSLGFSWQEGVVGNDLMEKLMQRILDEIDSIACTREVL